jgi:glycosyltransferase involved in cell wall biosynthesis
VEEFVARPFLSIVTRCCRRPVALARNQASLTAQSDPDWEQILIVDDASAGVLMANRSLAEHKRRVSGQYVMILDDDDYLIDSGLVERLRKIVVEHDPDIIMIRMDGPYGILPNQGWEKEPMLNDIGSPNYVVRSEIWKAHIEAFDGVPGDYPFAAELFRHNYTVHWCDVVAVKVPQRGWGRAEVEAE